MNFEEKVLSMLEAMNAKFDAKFDAMDKRFDAIENRLDAIEARLDEVENRLDAVETKLDKVENRLDLMDKKFVLIDKRFETITAKLAEVDVNFKVVNISLDDIETKLGELSMNAFHLGKTQIDLKLEFVNVKEAVLVNRVLLDECNDKIKVIAEAHEFNKGKFDEMEGIYSLKKDVDVLKLVATQHSEEIDRLRFAI